MKHLQFIFLRLSLYLIAGILLAFSFEIQQGHLMLFLSLVLVLFLFSYFRAQKQLFPDAFLGICSFLLIFSLGFYSAFFSKPENRSAHYIHQFTQPTDSIIAEGIISEELKTNKFSQRFILEVESLTKKKQSIPATGKVLMNIPIDSSHTSMLRPGTKIMLPWQPEGIKTALNPFQFDYSTYLKQLKIERQVTVDRAGLKITGNFRNTISSISWGVREKIIAVLKKQNFRKDELAVFQALILGQRRDISDQLYRNYAAAGAIHILAISGLHIGILLLMLNLMLRPLERIKNGKFVKAIFIIILLWGFAFLTGLSPSVVRAVCMFSFIAIGMQLKRKTGSLNSVFLSMFFLLLLNPYYLFQVGFQLSYLAVISIIIFQPVIYGIFSPRFKAIDYFWKLSSVSLAAQIGVMPLSIYYFHQFPGLFLLSNLVILPFLGLILGLGILVILLSLGNLLPGVIKDLFAFLLNAMNQFIEFIAGMDNLLISNIKLGALQSLALYLIIFSLVLLLRKIDFKSLAFFLLGILAFQVSILYTRSEIPFSESVIFHQNRKSLIGIKRDDRLSLYAERPDSINIPEDYIRERMIAKIERKRAPVILKLNGKLSLVVDTSANYKLSNFKPEILILQNSPRINLERLIWQLQPKQIIADGSNYRSYIDRWRKTSENEKIPFHFTGEKGAYILRN